MDIFKLFTHQRRERHETKRVVEDNDVQLMKFEALINPQLTYVGLKKCVNQYKVLVEEDAHKTAGLLENSTCTLIVLQV